MADNEAGIVSTALAVSLLALDTPAELQRLSREGWFKPEGPDRWRLVPLVQGFARAAKFTATTATTAQLAACWGVTKQSVGQVSAEGWFKPLDGRRGVFNWLDANAGYVRYLKDGSRRASKSAADSRVRDARAHEIEVRTAERLHRLVAIEEFEAMIEGICGAVRAELSGLPARFTRDLVQRRALEREIHGVLERLADTADTIAERVEKGRAADATVAANGAGSMGGDESDLSAVGRNSGSA
jgi:hypothetical protein